MSKSPFFSTRFYARLISRVVAPTFSLKNRDRFFFPKDTLYWLPIDHTERPWWQLDYEKRTETKLRVESKTIRLFHTDHGFFFRNSPFFFHCRLSGRLGLSRNRTFVNVRRGHFPPNKRVRRARYVGLFGVFVWPESDGDQSHGAVLGPQKVAASALLFSSPRFIVFFS